VSRAPGLAWLLLGVALTMAGADGHARVGYERLLADEANGDDWLSYSGGYRSERFSPLAQVTGANVTGLKVLWAYQMQPT
jgi:glucose dehydrogenase